MPRIRPLASVLLVLGAVYYFLFSSSATSSPTSIGNRFWSFVGRIEPLYVPKRYGQTIVAIGDVHGDLAHFSRLLKITKLADHHLRWSGRNGAVLVQTGDIVDRGKDTIAIYKLMESLRDDAVRLTKGKRKGRVVSLLGNHEYMNAMGDWRYVTKEDIATFGGAHQRRLAMSSNGWIGQAWLANYSATARIPYALNFPPLVPQFPPPPPPSKSSSALPSSTTDSTSPSESTEPLPPDPYLTYRPSPWRREYLQKQDARAMANQEAQDLVQEGAPDGWVRQSENDEKGDDDDGDGDPTSMPPEELFAEAAASFVHGGLSLSYPPLSAGGKKTLYDDEDPVAYVNQVGHSLLEKLTRPPLASPLGLPKDVRLEEREFWSSIGPMWYRGYALEEDEDTVCREADSVRRTLGVRRLVMGHTPFFEGIKKRCNGTVLLIDTGSSSAYGGALAALEISYSLIPQPLPEDAKPLPGTYGKYVRYNRTWLEREIIYAVYDDGDEGVAVPAVGVPRKEVLVREARLVTVPDPDMSAFP